MMVITLVPVVFRRLPRRGLTTQGVIAKVGDQEIGLQDVAQQARLIGASSSRETFPGDHALFDAARGAKSHHSKSGGL